MSYAADGDIANYSDLQAAIADWLARADLTVQIKAFIKLAERTISRTVRDKSVVAALTLDAATEVLPSAASELRSVRLNTATAGDNNPLVIVTMDELAEWRQRYTTAGRPRYASVIENTLYLVPAPDASHASEIVYYEKLVPLSAANPTNAILTDAPDIYLYASLVAAEPFLEHDRRMPMWKDQYKEAVQELNLERENQEFGASMRRKRLPVVFG